MVAACSPLSCLLRDIPERGLAERTLTDLDVPAELVTYPREGPGIGEPMHQRDLMTRNLRWFERWVLGNQ